jgi:hypothetical protein
MNNKTLTIVQIICLVALGLALILQAVLYFSVNARMTAIEQKQVVLERHMDVLREDQINISH